MNLVDQLRRTKLPDRTQLILTMAPGCLFGFPPPDLDAIMERVDCSTCRAIMEIVASCSERATALQQEIDAFCRPVREWNAMRRQQYERKHRRLIIGRLVRVPQYEQEPDYTAQPWYIEARRWFDEQNRELATLSDQDEAH